MKRTLCALFIMSTLTVSGLSAAGSLDGLWVGELQSDSGALAIQVSIRVDETGVGGSLMVDGSGETAIRKATIEGTLLKFDTVTRDAAATTLHWTGVISSDDISLSCTSDDPNVSPVQFVVHRQQ
jgi:hypothetical protein